MAQKKVKQKFLISFNEPNKLEPTQLYFLVYDTKLVKEEKLLEDLTKQLVETYGENNVKVEERTVTEFDHGLPSLIKANMKTKKTKGK